MTEQHPGTDTTPKERIKEAVDLYGEAWRMFERRAPDDYVKILFLSVIASGVLAAATAIVHFLAATEAPPEDEHDG